MPTAQSTTSLSSNTNKVHTESIKAMKSSVNSSKQNASGKTTPAPHSVSETSEQELTVLINTTSVTGGNKTPQEQPEFIKQSLIIIEKKVRNLEKRRQKLEEYKESQRKGTVLNEDQLLAVSKYEEVCRSLELSRELEKQFVGLANDAMKQQKKQLKKEQLEKEELVKEKIKESQKILSVLDTFGDESVRSDFLNETNGAFKLSDKEMNLLDEFNKLVKPSDLGARLESSATEVAEHLVCLIEAKNKPISSMNVNYFELRKLFDRIIASSYWNKQPEQQQEQEHEQPQQAEQIQNESEQLDSQKMPIVEQLNELNLTEQQAASYSMDEQKVAEQQQPAKIEQVFYHQQNTSDDYVIVSSSDLNENNTNANNTQSNKSPNSQQQSNKTFFTTLNQVELSTHRNINEFINRCENDNEGINFLQDSEIQSRQQQQDLQHNNMQQNEMNYQDSNQKDGNFKRGGNREHNGNQQRPYQQRPRHPDDRRSGGMQQQRMGGNQSSRNSLGTNGNGQNGGQQFNGRQSGGNGGGYRGGANSGNTGRGGYYRGQNNNPGGARGNSRGNFQPAPRTNQEVHHQQQMA